MHLSAALLATSFTVLTSAQNLRGNSRVLSDYKAIPDVLRRIEYAEAHVAQQIKDYHPVFDFDGDSCLPAAAIAQSGIQNNGLSLQAKEDFLKFKVLDRCRSPNFMEQSNTYHRYGMRIIDDVTFEIHMYELYFEFDGTFHGFGGHNHDIETVLVVLRNGVPYKVGASAHGSYAETSTLLPVREIDLLRDWDDVPKLDGKHPMIVYHSDGALTHAFRYASSPNEMAENPDGEYVIPSLASWSYTDSWAFSNDQYMSKMNNFNFGAASFKGNENFEMIWVDLGLYERANELQCTGWPGGYDGALGGFQENCEKGNLLDDGYVYIFNEYRYSPSFSQCKSDQCW